jgi:asparagine synthase (glutamine-hydrolysing)
MCGIAGTLGVSSPDVAAAMSDAIAHRGPDDCGLFFDGEGRVALAHRRLSIIDLSPCGHQPMPYDGGRYQIVFNGEVYNFAGLRRELEALGHRFASRSDTEVVLAAYAQWGEASVRRLRGMFAFAIYDRDSRELFLARDRFGIKPLCFTFQQSAFLFASELKGLLASGLVQRRLDLEALWFYLSLGSVPQPRTALRDVATLLPGHTMCVRADLSFEIVRYWDLADASKAWEEEVRTLDAAGAARRLRDLLDEATRLHMIADVPVGAFLSGGIDSTAVVGLMTRVSGSRIRTFSVGFADDDSVTDEREWARLAARRFDSEHTEVVVDGREVAAQFDDIVRAIDQPSLDGTNTFVVSKAAAQSLKVALSGLGGDELFAGYPHFRRLHRAARFNRRLGAARGIVRHIPGRFVHDRDFLVATEAERYGTLRALVEDHDKPGLLSAEVASSMARTPMTSFYEQLLRHGLDSVAQTSYVEVRAYLLNTLLRDADAMSMAWSLEVRPVLLDHVLAEFAFALPAAWKLNRSTNKPVLVDAVRDVLPAELLHRRKLGFELPLQSWLVGPLRERAIDVLCSPAATTVFSAECLAATVEDLRARRRPSVRVWSYVILVEWLRSFRVEA